MCGKMPAAFSWDARRRRRCFDARQVQPAKERRAPLAIPLERTRCSSWPLIITGMRDLPYNQAVCEVLVAGLGNVSELKLPHASHMANMEDPAAVNHAIAAFAGRSVSLPG